MFNKNFKQNKNFKKKKITKFIPYKSPFLFFDKIISFKNSFCITSTKKISLEKGYLQNHFPGNLIFPGVLILESILQTCCYLINKSAYKNFQYKFCKNSLCYVVNIENSKFKKKVVLNDKLIIKVKILKIFLKKFAKISGLVFVKKYLVCQSLMVVYSKNLKYLNF